MYSIQHFGGKVMNKMPKNFVIGLTGSIGSGCTTISKALEKHGFKRISLSKPIKERFEKLHKKEPTKEYGDDWRYELQTIGNEGRKGRYTAPKNNKSYSKNLDYWVQIALKEAKDYSGDIVIVGIRNPGEVESLRKTFPQGHFWLIAVYADYSTRWKRIDQLNIYTNEKLFKRDDIRDSDEDDPAGQNVKDCVYMADYVMRNDVPIEPPSAIGEILAKKLLDQIAVMKGENPRNPTSDEVFMATAVSQSHASQCLQRKVGL